ncbi:hypothetical protein K439DRAFT_442432 [Ramaria rubella]|nr:hypothetical protein K439DRAFT_442432 [Ramaria rubella]
MQSNSTSQAIDAVFQGQFLLDYTGLSALVFFAYDHILSISREVQLIWRKNFRVTTSLYLATRYLPLPLLVVQLLPLISTPNQETVLYNLYHKQRVKHILSDRHYNGVDFTDICNI